MRYIGIDYGSKRVGIALSDDGGQFAIPLIVLKNTERLEGEIADIAKENGATTFILGESNNYKGEANKIMPEVHALKKELEEMGFTVHLEPEFMTSEHAERFQGKNDMLDASAAALILQSFLDSDKGKELSKKIMNQK